MAIVHEADIILKNETGAYNTPALVYGDGDTKIYESADDSLMFMIAAGVRFAMYSTMLCMQGGASTGYWALMNEIGSTTNPNIVPNKADYNSGIGSATSNQFSLIAASEEILRITTDGLLIPGAANNIAFYDADTYIKEADDDIIKFFCAISGADTDREIFQMDGTRYTVSVQKPYTTSGVSTFSVNRYGYNVKGTVTTNGSVTLIGSGTFFINDFKAGSLIYVSGETVRTVATVVSDTELTVTVAFSTSQSGLSYYTTTNYNLFTVKGNNYVGIGITLPEGMLHVFEGTNCHSYFEGNNNVSIIIGNYNPSPNNKIVQRSSLGSKSAMTILTTGKSIGIFDFQGYKGDGFISAAAINAVTTVDWVQAGVKDTAMVFSIMNTAGTGLNEAMRIKTGPYITMSGTLQANHIEEVTTDHGVVIDGVTVKDNGVIVPITTGKFAFGDGDCYFYQGTDGTIAVQLTGTQYMQFNVAGFATDHIVEFTINHGVEIDGVLFKDYYIDAQDGSLKHLYIYAGDASGGAGTDAGNLILKSGDAIFSDSGSTAGYIYLVPGNGYDTNQSGQIYLGATSFNSGTINLSTTGSSASVGLNIKTKGTGSLLIVGEQGTNALLLRGQYIDFDLMTWYYGSNILQFSTDNSIIKGTDGGVSSVHGKSIIVTGGDAYATGDNNGGSLYLRRGAKANAGTDGSIYFGTGAACHLATDDAETYLVAIDSTTGLLSKRAVSSISGVTPTDNILDWVAASNWYAPYAAQTTGCFDSSTTDPAHTTRLNYDGNFYARTLYATGGTIQVNEHEFRSYAVSNGADLRMGANSFATGYGSIGTASNHAVAFYVNSGQKMTIDTSGNVAMFSDLKVYNIINARGSDDHNGFAQLVTGDSTYAGYVAFWAYNAIGAQRQGYIGNDVSGISVHMEVGAFNVMYGSEFAIKTTGNGAVELYYDGTKVIETLSTSTARVSGKLGINTDPTWFLHVTGAVASDVIAYIINTSSTGYGLKIKGGGSTNYSLLVSDYNDNARFQVDADGHTNMGAYVGIGAAHSGTYNLNVSGTIYASGDIYGNSDLRNKTILGTEQDVWKRGFGELEIKRFRYHGEADATIGYIAQNILEYFPDCVSYDSERDRFAIKMLSMSALNTLAIQEVKNEVDLLKKRVDKLEQK